MISPRTRAGEYTRRRAKTKGRARPPDAKAENLLHIIEHRGFGFFYILADLLHLMEAKSNSAASHPSASRATKAENRILLGA
jgi:hypothetical protein